MDDLSLDSHDSPHNGDDSKHAPKAPKKKQRKEKDIDATNDAKKKDKEKKKPAKNSKQQKKDKKGKAKQKIPASSSSSALSPTKNRPTAIISGSTCVGLSTREFSHDQEGDDSSSSLSPSLPATRPALSLMASPSSYLGSRASRGSMPQFASSPELLDLSSVRSRPKSSIIAPSAASSDSAIPPPTPTTTKLSPPQGKEKNAHSSSGFDATGDKATPSTSGAAKTRSRSGSSECLMEGFLEEALLKRVGSTHTRRVSKWRKRWVRLFRCDAGTFLLTHDKPPAAGKKPTSVRSRIDVLAMVTTEKRDDIRRHAFVLMPDDCDRQPPAYFCAHTEGARKSWMAAITRVQQQEVSDIVQPLRSRQQEPGKEKEESELRPGMTSLDFEDLAEDKRRKRTMVLVNGEEKREKVLDIQEEQDQLSDEDSEEARMMRDIERRVQELSAAQHQPRHPSGFGPSAPALSMSSVPAYYHPQQQLQVMQQHQHQQQQVLLRQQSYSVVGPHHPAPGATLSGSYNPFVEAPSAAAVPQHHLQPQSSASYYMQPPVRRGSFVAADLSSSHSALPQAQTVVMSTLSAAAVSPSTSTSISSISPHGTPPAGLPSPHIPPPFMRQSSSIHMAAAHHNSHHLLSSAPSAVAQS